MFICINCKHLNYCKTYHFIEKQHHLHDYNNNKQFNPNNTIIHINLKKTQKLYIFDWDVVECLSFIEQPGIWQIK